MTRMTTQQLSTPASATDFIAREHRNFIGGEWVEAANGARLDVIDPGRGTVQGSIAAGDEVDIDRAVAAARASFEAASWRGLAPAVRAEILWAIADGIHHNAA